MARGPDIAGVLVLTAGLVQGEWAVLAGTPLLGMDTATAFYPWYAWLGQSLRAGEMPVWNPHQFAGTPFAADPESGWMYLPAMVMFSLFALPVAAKGFVLLHVLFAGWFTYALARTLGAGVAGATLAGAAYGLSGFLFGHGVCCFAYASVAVWLPLVWLGAERALRSTGWLARAVWWGAAGFGLSQILAAWVGQGSYYAVLLLAAYLVSRTLLGPARPAKTRVLQLLLHGSGIVLFAMCLAAAGLLPRLEYNAVSNLPGGYPDQAASAMPSLTDWGLLTSWNQVLLLPSFYYAGISTVGLALVAPLVAARRPGVLLCAVLVVAVLVLSRYEPTPLHWLLSLLPGYARLTERSPERALIVFYLPCALLAAATVTRISQLRRWPRVAQAAAWLLVIGVVGFDLEPANRALLAQAQRGEAAYELQRIDLASYYAPPPSIRFLQSQAAASGPFRYFGYAQHVSGVPIPYTLRWPDARTAALGVNNLAVLSGLDDVQGYNPIHVARYDEFLTALNGGPQDYHHANILDGGLNSPLLDLLNARYVIVPTVTASDEVPPRLERGFPLVYADADVRIFENPNALPRARLVHAALQVSPGDVLGVLQSTSVDPRHTALLEAPLPELAKPDEPDADLVTVTAASAGASEFETSSTAPGLLVLSEVCYPAWQAFLDDRPAQLYVADHAFRAVAVPAGRHVVKLRYDSVPLRVGMWVSGGAYVLLLGLLLRAGYSLRRPGRRPRSRPRCGSDSGRPAP